MTGTIEISNARYRRKILDLFGASVIAYLPLGEAYAPTVRDISGNSRNGTTGGSTGPTLGVTGIGDGFTALSFPGSNACVDWYSAGLAGAFNGAEGTLIVWAKVSAAGVWSDGTGRYIARLSADANNDIRIMRSQSNNNMVLIQHIAGGTSRPMYVGSNAYTNWLMFGVSWSVAAGEVFAWVNGCKFGPSLGAPGTWTGSLASTLTLLGASSTAAGDVYSGSEAHALLLNRPATEAEMLRFYKATGTPKVITVIGDSISQPSTNILKWTEIVRDGYNSGRTALVSHAVSAQTILDHMDAQVVAAANDDADIVIIEMGTNDTTTTGLQAEVEENIIELKSNHPNATLYFMNILPRWTDAGGGTPVDKSAFRTAIAAACTAQSITCWDTYTTPWITAADTTDGLHPNAAGHSKIGTEVLGRI